MKWVMLAGLLACVLASPAFACRVEQHTLSQDRPLPRSGETVLLLEAESVLLRRAGGREPIAFRMRVLKGSRSLPPGRRITVPAPDWKGCISAMGVPDRNGRVRGYAGVRPMVGRAGIFEIGRSSPANVGRLEYCLGSPQRCVWGRVRFKRVPDGTK